MAEDVLAADTSNRCHEESAIVPFMARFALHVGAILAHLVPSLANSLQNCGTVHLTKGGEIKVVIAAKGRSN